MSFLADTNVVSALTLVTRNTAHFYPIVKALLNPWT
jgi:predicted nucleic acid-binding protein